MSGPPLATAEVVERELERLERSFATACSSEPDAIAALVPAARSAGRPSLLARSLCLAARAQISRGDHESATATVAAGLAEFASLPEAEAEALASAHAELWRTGGNALLKLGRIGEALPMLESAVRFAEHAVQRPVQSAADRLHAAHTFVRCANNLASALAAVGEIDAAVELHERLAAAGAPFGADPGVADDLLLARWNAVDALLERVGRSRQAGADERAVACDLRAAQNLLDRAPALLNAGVGGYARHGYLTSLGRLRLAAGRPADAREMFARQLADVAAGAGGAMDALVAGVAETGLAQAELALGEAPAALDHSTRALEHFAKLDDLPQRVRVTFVRAQALRQLGDASQAYAALESYHALRARLEDRAAREYASRITASTGLTRARAEAEAHRLVAATLETLGGIGQEITAHLDAEAVVRILHRHIGALLDASYFCVWLHAAEESRLTLAFGVEGGRALHGDPVALDDPEAWPARAFRERRELIAATRSAGDTPAAPDPAHVAAGTLLAPLVSGDRVLGVLALRSDRAEAFAENERSIVRTLCAYGAIALDNASAYRELALTVSRLEMTQRELSLKTAEYERLSMTDALTGVPNRRHFLERALIEIEEARRNGTSLAIAMLDIDHFKVVNDRHGHAVGDRVLQQIAHVAKDALRTADLLARIGGEEFALLLPGAGPAEAVAIAERVRNAIEQMRIELDAGELRVTASFGVAKLAAGEETFDAAFARADRALYRSKQGGRNRISGEGV